jgi:hypothetical protein
MKIDRGFPSETFELGLVKNDALDGIERSRLGACR